MGRADRLEVAMIQDRHLGFLESLGKGHDARIDDAQLEVAVAGLELAAPG